MGMKNESVMVFGVGPGLGASAQGGIHVAHFVIDGVIGRDSNDRRLDPDAIAETYYQVHLQHRSSWSFNVDLRPWVEKF